MKKIVYCAAICLFTASVTVNAQKEGDYTLFNTTKTTDNDDSFVLLNKGTYQADKKYAVMKIWNSITPLSDTEKKDLLELKEELSKKGVEVILAEWKTEDDLKKLVKPFGMEVDVSDGKQIHLRSGGLSMNTTSAKALYLLENDKPILLCSGTHCENKLKYFFKLQALN